MSSIWEFYCTYAKTSQVLKGEPILFLSAYSLLGIALSRQETTVIKTNSPTKLMFSLGDKQVSKKYL